MRQQLYARNTHRNRVARGVLVSKRKATARQISCSSKRTVAIVHNRHLKGDGRCLGGNAPLCQTISILVRHVADSPHGLAVRGLTLGGAPTLDEFRQRLGGIA